MAVAHSSSQCPFPVRLGPALRDLAHSVNRGFLFFFIPRPSSCWHEAKTIAFRAMRVGAGGGFWESWSGPQLMGSVWRECQPARAGKHAALPQDAYLFAFGRSHPPASDVFVACRCHWASRSIANRFARFFPDLGSFAIL